MSVGCGIVATYRNVDRVVDYDGSVHHRAVETACTAVSGAGAETSAKSDVAIPAIAASTGDLNRALIDFDVVRLLSIGRGIVAGYSNVDRVIDDDRSVEHRAVETACAAVSGAAAVPSAKRDVAIPAIAANSGDLSRALIDFNVVRLLGISCGIVAGHRDIDRHVHDDR